MALGRRGWAVVGSVAPLLLVHSLGAWMFDKPDLDHAESIRRVAWWTVVCATGPLFQSVHVILRS